MKNGPKKCSFDPFYGVGTAGNILPLSRIGYQAFSDLQVSRTLTELD